MGTVILLVVHFQNLDWFWGSFLDKRALPVGSFKFHEISTKRY